MLENVGNDGMLIRRLQCFLEKKLLLVTAIYPLKPFSANASYSISPLKKDRKLNKLHQVE